MMARLTMNPKGFTELQRMGVGQVIAMHVSHGGCRCCVTEEA